MGSRLLLLQLAPLALQALTQVQLVRELLVVLHAKQEGTAQPPTWSRVLFAMQAGMAQVVAMRLLVLMHVTQELTVMGSPLLLQQLAPPVRQASTAQALGRRVLVLGYVTLEHSVMGSPLLLLQLAPLALQALTQV